MTGLSRRRLRAGMLIVAVAFLMPALVPAPAQAHSMTFNTTRYWDVCVASGATASHQYYSAAGTPDSTHATRVVIGLDGGDSTAFARWNFYTIDDNISAEVARWQGAARDWTSSSTYVFANTMTAHVGGAAIIESTITNTDGVQQCFQTWARTAWD